MTSAPTQRALASTLSFSVRSNGVRLRKLPDFTGCRPILDGSISCPSTSWLCPLDPTGAELLDEVLT